LGPSISFAEYKAHIEFNLGLAYYLNFEKIRSRQFKTSDAVKNLTEAVKFLKNTESDPIRGKYYKMAQSLLESFSAYEKGFELLTRGLSLESIPYLNQYLDVNPLDSMVWTKKGLALHDLRRYEEAIQCYDKALEINPNYATAHYEKGLTFNNLRRYEEAIQCYDKALEIDPNFALALNNKRLAVELLGRQPGGGNEHYHNKRQELRKKSWLGKFFR
jgi:tetratricopeptide (TPR) repeat protein